MPLKLYKWSRLRNRHCSLYRTFSVQSLSFHSFSFDYYCIFNDCFAVDLFEIGFGHKYSPRIIGMPSLYKSPMVFVSFTLARLCIRFRVNDYYLKWIFFVCRNGNKPSTIRNHKVLLQSLFSALNLNSNSIWFFENDHCYGYDDDDDYYYILNGIAKHHQHHSYYFN